MKVIALTGGIGSGKSSFGALLASEGAIVVDADRIARKLQEPGEAGFTEIVRTWGDQILTADGGLDRAKLAATVFSDLMELKKLENIIHPKVHEQIHSELSEINDENTVILELPLLNSKDKYLSWISGVIVIESTTEAITKRLIENRDMSHSEAESRIKSQIGNEERIKLADYVIDNSKGIADLADQLPSCWKWIKSLPDVSIPPLELW